MQQDTLKALLAAREKKQPVVLATHLETGAERLIGPSSTDDPLYAQALDAVRSDFGTPVGRPECFFYNEANE